VPHEVLRYASGQRANSKDLSIVEDEEMRQKKNKMQALLAVSAHGI
jgi:hypothetical protein